MEKRNNYLDRETYLAWREEMKAEWLAKTVHRKGDGNEPPLYMLGVLKAHGSIYDDDQEIKELFQKLSDEAPADGFYTFVACDKQGRTRYVIHDKRNGMIYDSKDTPITVDITKMSLFAEDVLRNITYKKGND